MWKYFLNGIDSATPWEGRGLFYIYILYFYGSIQFKMFFFVSQLCNQQRQQQESDVEPQQALFTQAPFLVQTRLQFIMEYTGKNTH